MVGRKDVVLHRRVVADDCRPLCRRARRVAIADAQYNSFCREFFRFKRDILGATELNHSEIRGQHAFTKAAFKRQRLHGDSHWLAAIDAMFKFLVRHDAKTFMVWTDAADHVDLRNADPSSLADTYKKLLYDFRRLMRREAKGQLASLNFDQRSFREDETAACAIQNFIVRTICEATGGGTSSRYRTSP
jgi:hypothetical protein